MVLPSATREDLRTVDTLPTDTRQTVSMKVRFISLASESKLIEYADRDPADRTIVALAARNKIVH